MLTHGDRAARMLTSGASLGIAYHLGIDATLDGEGTYKDLPVELPLEGHQAIAAANAAIEMADTTARPGTIIGTFSSYQAAAETAMKAKSTSFKIRRAGHSDSFNIVFSPRQT